MRGALGDWILGQLRKQRLQVLTDMTDEQLMALWDQYDGCNAPGGHEGEDIHLVLNLKGLGDYCRV